MKVITVMLPVFMSMLVTLEGCTVTKPRRLARVCWGWNLSSGLYSSGGEGSVRTGVVQSTINVSLPVGWMEFEMSNVTLVVSVYLVLLLI